MLAVVDPGGYMGMEGTLVVDNYKHSTAMVEPGGYIGMERTSVVLDGSMTTTKASSEEESPPRQPEGSMGDPKENIRAPVFPRHP